MPECGLFLTAICIIENGISFVNKLVFLYNSHHVKFGKNQIVRASAKILEGKLHYSINNLKYS